MCWDAVANTCAEAEPTPSPAHALLVSHRFLRGGSPVTQTEWPWPGGPSGECRAGREAGWAALGRPGPVPGEMPLLSRWIICFGGSLIKDRLCGIPFLTKQCLRFPSSSPSSLQESNFIFFSKTLSVCKLRELSSHSQEARSFVLVSEDVSPPLAASLYLPWALPPCLVQATGFLLYHPAPNSPAFLPRPHMFRGTN